MVRVWGRWKGRKGRKGREEAAPGGPRAGGGARENNA